jgi:putative SOS response-associated peptidase YedK
VCNDFGNHVAYAEYAEALRHLGMPIVAPVAAPNLEPKEDIWPSEVATVFRRHEEGVKLARLRWGFEPSNPKGRAVINFRSEGRSFANSRRCLVPASHFFEFKGAKAPKSKFKFTLRDEPWFYFASLSSPGTPEKGEAFTLLTTAPGPDVALIHSRQMVVLKREDWKHWLDLSRAENELLSALPAGRLAIDQVR